jgi:hypothetical protein
MLDMFSGSVDRSDGLPPKSLHPRLSMNAIRKVVLRRRLLI